MEHVRDDPVSRKAVWPIYRIFSLYLTITFPILLVLVSARLVMTPVFLRLVYTRPGFPQDYYGFTTQDRLNYAPYALAYLLNGEDIEFLGNLRLADGKDMYNARELRHMRDVKLLTQIAFGGAVVAGGTALAAGFALAHRPGTRYLLRRALIRGSTLTLAMIAAIVLVAVLNWDYFFTGFHSLFFTSGTWRFEYSDTLIRLFPEAFWFEAALTIGGLTVAAAALTLIIAWRWQPEGDMTFDKRAT